MGAVRRGSREARRSHGAAARHVPRNAGPSAVAVYSTVVLLRSRADAASIADAGARALRGTGQQHHRRKEQRRLGGRTHSRWPPGLHTSNSSKGESWNVRSESWKQQGNGVIATIRTGLLFYRSGLARKTDPRFPGVPVVADPGVVFRRRRRKAYFHQKEDLTRTAWCCHRGWRRSEFFGRYGIDVPTGRPPRQLSRNSPHLVRSDQKGSIQKVISRL